MREFTRLVADSLRESKTKTKKHVSHEQQPFEFGKPSIRANLVIIVSGMIFMAVLRVQPGLEIVHTESSEQVRDRESERERRAQQQVVDQGFRIFNE